MERRHGQRGDPYHQQKETHHETHNPGLLLAAAFVVSPTAEAEIMDSFYRSYFNGLCAGGDRAACGQAGDLNRDHAQRELLDEQRQQTYELQQLRQELRQLRGLNRELGR